MTWVNDLPSLGSEQSRCIKNALLSKKSDLTVVSLAFQSTRSTYKKFEIVNPYMTKKKVTLNPTLK